MTEIASIQWFPGHMTKTRRMIKENLSLVDAVVEIIDARIPMSSRNPEMTKMLGNKPRMFLLNKSDMADEKITQKWIEYFKNQNITSIPIDCRNGKGTSLFLSVLKNQVLSEFIKNKIQKGMTGKQIRIMIVGIPNVGKSSFINKMARTKITKVEDRPGVTRHKQWVKLGDGVEMLDMPGVLWPKFDDQKVAHKLAFTGAIKDDVVDIEALSMLLLDLLKENYQKNLIERYKIEISEDDNGKKLLEKICLKRAMLLPGGVLNTERAAITVVDEFRAGKLGKISLERP